MDAWDHSSLECCPKIAPIVLVVPDSLGRTLGEGREGRSPEHQSKWHALSRIVDAAVHEELCERHEHVPFGCLAGGVERELQECVSDCSVIAFHGSVGVVVVGNDEVMVASDRLLE